jgi:hypothetical protein
MVYKKDDRVKINMNVSNVTSGRLHVCELVTQIVLCHADIGLEIREYGRRDPSFWPRGTVYPQKSALSSPTSGGRWVSIVRSRTDVMEFLFSCRQNNRTDFGTARPFYLFNNLLRVP